MIFPFAVVVSGCVDSHSRENAANDTFCCVGQLSRRTVSDSVTVVSEIVANAEKMLDDLFNAQGERLKAVLSELVDGVDLGWKEKRRTRFVASGEVRLKSDLTGRYRGDRTPIELFYRDASTMDGEMQAYIGNVIISVSATTRCR